MPTADFQFDLKESFPRLARAPIVEAVIHWQARAQKAFDSTSLDAVLAERLPRYTLREPLHQLKLMAMISAEEDASVVKHDRGWEGIRLKSAVGPYIAQFKRDGLLFSRTQGYDHWEPFLLAAKEAWQVYVDLAAPVEIQRLGVRFINHLPSATPENLGEVLREPPTCPSNLPLKEFVYQSTFNVPGAPFDVRVIKVMQPTMPDIQPSSGLFLDIDVFSTKAIPNEPEAIDDTLGQMRWLKNKVFFALLTDAAVQSFS
jgi:uncharacterized protein (TIGR04255 family)